MNTLYTYFRLVCGCACAALTYLFGGFDMLMKALIAFVVIDYVSGVISAAIKCKVSSEVGYRGLIKKAGIFLVVALAQLIAKITGAAEIRSVAIGFYLANEGISILENVGKMGVEYPEALKNILCQLKKESDESENKH